MMTLIRAGMVIVGVLVASLSLLAAVVGMEVLLKPHDGGSFFGWTILAATVVILSAGGTYAGYTFVRAAVRIGHVAGAGEQRLVRQWAVWIVFVGVLGATLPFPLFEKILLGVVLVIVGLAGLAQELEPQRTPRRLRPRGRQGAK